MATRRVHNLAKELGIKSTAIVAKCQAEGLTIKNHMSTLSAGLEATIREWFGEDSDLSTTVEHAAKVNLEEVKSKPARRRSKKKVEDENAGAPDETAVAIVEAPTEEQPIEPVKADEEIIEIETIIAKPISDTTRKTAKAAKAKPKRKSPKDLVETDQVKQVAEAPAEDQSGEKVASIESEPSAGQSPASGSSPRILSHLKPENQKVIEVKPVPFVPTPAVLEGPTVIRTERPDFIPAPRSRPPRKQTPVGNNETQAGASVNDKAGGGRGGSTAKRGRRKLSLDDDRSRGAAAKKGANKQQRRRGGGRHAFSGGQVDVQHQFGDRDLQEREARLAQASGNLLHRRERQMASKGGGSLTTIERKKILKATIKEPITVKNLSGTIGIRAHEISSKLMETGIMATVNQVITSEAAEMIALGFEVELEIEARKLLLDVLQEDFAKEYTDEKREPRPPVVAFLGHVDHGKTSLLDQIRKASVTTGEAGGITQHIGSYLYDDGQRRVTFLDTPGHKAFTEMRARGANMTDIVVLVVAADDGIMPQTEEAINHARAAGVPIVVALNKVDLQTADVNRCLGQLAEKELISSEWGGNTEIVKTSASTGEGISDLIEHLDYIAELNHLKAQPAGPATGWIIEAQMSTQKGSLARMLVKEGCLKAGDIVVTGCSYGRVRTIHDPAGIQLKKAGPAIPIEITGLDGVPVAGDKFFVVDNMTKAAEIANEQKSQLREKTLASRRQITLENLFSEIKAGEIKELNIIIKADVQGSVDVLRQAITELNTSEVAVRILHAAVGGISESDIVLAEASNAIIIGFQVVADEHARNMAEKDNVEIRLYRVIYKITDDIKLALEGMLTPDIEEKTLGRAEVRQTFKISRLGVIAGCYVQDGLINRSANVRIVRDSVIIRNDGAIDTLRRGKDDASEVRSGLECGIKIAGFDDIKNGDVIEAYQHIKINRTLESVANKDKENK